jgi:uncharacterized membrane protein
LIFFLAIGYRQPMARKQTSLISGRFDTLDALRGFAMAWMTVFHFCFDLNHVGLWRQNFYSDPIWTWQRTLILSLFLFCAGLGQAIALAQGQSWRRFWRRWLLVAGGALLVSAGSWLMYPQSFIYFGVLHGMAVMLILVRLTVGCGAWLWWLGGLAIALQLIAFRSMDTWASVDFVQYMNAPWLNWLGLITRLPVTEDYVPLLPWMGVMWWGMASGLWVIRQRPHWLCQALPAAFAPLASLGRWSLSYYLLHQPVLIGLLTASVWLLG